MSQRCARVNELIQREISQLIHTRFKNDAVAITISEVDCAPDLRSGIVYYSVLGGEDETIRARRFFAKNGREINHEMSRVITMKYSPKLSFHLDESMARGCRIMDIIHEIDAESGPTPKAEDPSEQE